MTLMTIQQVIQLGHKCSMCDQTAKWLHRFDENAPAYCDGHFPGGMCEKENLSCNGNKDENKKTII
jgi:hypothetical protein